MATLFENTPSLLDLETRATQAEVVTWQGRKALRLEDGLALIPDQRATDASVGVLIGVDGPAYPGVAFRVADVLNFELAYAVPHVSGQWDALQYDPVFHGSNTWQVYHGQSYKCRLEQVGCSFLLQPTTYNLFAESTGREALGRGRAVNDEKE